MSGSAQQVSSNSSWNKNSWHWEEKNLNKIAQEGLSEIFSNVKVEFEGGELVILRLASFDGDVYTNIRKGKKILGYDFSLKLDWEGSVSSDSVVKGVAKIPEVSTEEDDIEVEISVTSSPNTDVEDKVKAAMRKKGSETIKDKIKEFLNEIKTNYGKQE